LYKEFGAKGFEVLQISFRENPDLVRRTVQERGYVAPVLLDESGDVTGRAYGVWGPGTKYFIDRKGRVVGRHVGPKDWNTPAGRAFIRALLEADTKP
jgi:peroxiredoxin